MLIVIYDKHNGKVLPEAKWELYVSGLIDQAHHSTKDITVSLGCSLPFVLLQNYIRNQSISNNDIMFYDLDLKLIVLVDEDGHFQVHHTIGSIHQDAMMALF